MTSLREIARQFEVERNTAQTEARELRRKLADFTNQDELDSEAPLSKRNRTNGEAGEEVMNEETQVINAGQRFVILHSPWLRLGEKTFSVEHDPESDEIERFENNDNKVQGQLREIKQVLGTRLASEMSSEAWIVKAVS
jgi:hypothetical protein